MRFFSTRNGILSCFLFRGLVRNRIPRVCFYFCSTEQNSELFSLPRNGSEQNSESLLLFLFHRTAFQVVFSSAEGFGREFREYASIFVPRNGIPSCFLFPGKGSERNSAGFCSAENRNSVGNKHLFRLFRLPRNYFLSEIPNPTPTPPLQYLIHPFFLNFPTDYV
jgi:hypothetical protein